MLKYLSSIVDEPKTVSELIQTAANSLNTAAIAPLTSIDELNTAATALQNASTKKLTSTAAAEAAAAQSANAIQIAINALETIASALKIDSIAPQTSTTVNALQTASDAILKTRTALQTVANETQSFEIALETAANEIRTAANELKTVSGVVIKRPETEVFYFSKQRKSERITWNKNGKKEFITFRNPTIVPNVIDIKPGEAILFRQDLPHAGCGYLNSNLRIHAAFDINSRFFFIYFFKILIK